MSANVIAIDGPAGAGKSTIAKILAREMRYLYIDSGSMYRVVALFAIRRGIAFNDEANLAKLCAAMHIVLDNADDGYKVFCNNEDVTQAIRTPDVSAAASPVSAVFSVRQAMVDKQRQLAFAQNVVMDGRDIGTNVFPFAGCKIFLTAAIEERAYRRTKELLEQGFDVTEEAVQRDLEDRDKRDSNRSYAPLRKAEDAVEIDSTNLSIEQVVEMAKSIARNKLIGCA